MPSLKTKIIQIKFTMSLVDTRDDGPLVVARHIFLANEHLFVLEACNLHVCAVLSATVNFWRLRGRCLLGSDRRAVYPVGSRHQRRESRILLPRSFLSFVMSTNQRCLIISIPRRTCRKIVRVLSKVGNILNRKESLSEPHTCKFSPL